MLDFLWTALLAFGANDGSSLRSCQLANVGPPSQATRDEDFQGALHGLRWDQDRRDEVSQLVARPASDGVSVGMWGTCRKETQCLAR
jgi:hypothetical protein